MRMLITLHWKRMARSLLFAEAQTAVADIEPQVVWESIQMSLGSMAVITMLGHSPDALRIAQWQPLFHSCRVLAYTHIGEGYRV